MISFNAFQFTITSISFKSMIFVKSEKSQMKEANVFLPISLHPLTRKEGLIASIQ
jgi:hypothetical protein